MEEKLLKRIVVNPQIMAGKPVIKGTRIPVDLIVKLVARGAAYEEIRKDFPYLTKKDVKAALMYAAEVTGSEEIFPL